MKRKAEIIKLIWNETKPISVETIARSLRVSPKTIRNELDELHHVLMEHHIHLIKKPGQGITLEGSSEAKQKLMAYFQSWDEQKMLSPIDRQRNLLAKLFAENRPLLIKSLSLDYYVSRSTITKDITELNKRLNAFNLRIDYLKGEGICIIGEEADQRKAMAKLVPLGEAGSLK